MINYDQQTVHQYLHAKLNVFTKNATENTVVMTNKEANQFQPKWIKESRNN